MQGVGHMTTGSNWSDAWLLEPLGASVWEELRELFFRVSMWSVPLPAPEISLPASGAVREHCFKPSSL